MPATERDATTGATGAGGASRRLGPLLIVVGLILGVGVASLHLLGGTSGALPLDLYLILRLFVLEGEWAFESRSNWVVQLLAFVAPAVTILGVLELITRRVRRGLHRWWALRRTRRHTIVVGLTHESLRLIEAWARERRRVVVIDAHPHEDLLARCDRLGVPVVEGRASDQEVLRRARVTRATSAVALLDSLDAQVAFAVAAGRAAAAASPDTAEDDPGLDLWLAVQDASFAEKLAAQVSFGALGGRAHPRFFDLGEIAARQLLTQHPLDVYADVLGHPAIHVAGYGCGGVGQAVIVEAARQIITNVDARLQVSVFDRDPAASRLRIAAQYPHLDKVVELRFHHLLVHPGGIAGSDYARLPDRATAHVIAFNDDALAVTAALSLRRMLLGSPEGETGPRRLNAPILVRLRSRDGLAALLRAHAGSGAARVPAMETPDGIFPFGTIEDVFAPSAILDDVREDLARSLHLSYRREREELRALYRELHERPGPAEREWRRLDHTFREASRANADHIPVKLRAVGARVVAASGRVLPPPADREFFTGDELRRLERIEHRRWCAERHVSGWSYGPARLDAVRQHPLLVPWDALAPHEREVDLAQIRTIPLALSRVGGEARRTRVVGILGAPGSPGDVADAASIARLCAVLAEHAGAPDDAAPLVLTRLASSGEIEAAAYAAQLTSPSWVVLPLPFEVYREDFGPTGAAPPLLLRFLRLVASSERYLEVPMRFGAAAALTIERRAPTTPEGARARAARADQYRLAAAYILERADVLILVHPDDPGARAATEEYARWWRAGSVPEPYRSGSTFFPSPNPSARRLIEISRGTASDRESSETETRPLQ